MVDEIQKEVKRFYTFLPLSKIFLIQNTRNDETRILRREALIQTSQELRKLPVTSYLESQV